MPSHLELLDLPAGEVRLSDRRKQRAWTVELSPFQLGGTAVTVGTVDELLGRRSGEAPALPIVDVSWWDAVRLCNELSVREGLAPCYAVDASDGTPTWDRVADGYRLPTEAEWEHACRAGAPGTRYGHLAAIAWYRDSSTVRRRTLPSFAAGVLSGSRPSPPVG